MDALRCAAFSAYALLVVSASAQEFRATISGQVGDAQGAVVPQASVHAINVGTGASFSGVSAADGQYSLPFLPPGDYRLTAEATGFKKFVREGLRVSTNERITINIELEVGQVTEVVNVTSERSLLETASASTGQVISARQIDNMPLNGRTPLVLAQLAFGVVPSSDPRFYRPFDNAGPSDFSMGGSPGRSNELLIDGAPDTTTNRRVAYNPPVDAVEEVKVETFMADAAYGHTSGGTVNVVLKSGTNAVHGTAYEFNQVSNLAAGQFFTNRAGQPKPVTRYNQWGINAGGPIYLPKIYDGRNKWFFYFAYEGVRDALPRPEFATIPSEKERRGDFSDLLGVGSIYQIYDPASGVREGGRIRRTPIANNVIPANRLSPVGQRYLQYYPQPNQFPNRDGQDNLVISATGERNDFVNYLGRMDFNISEKHKLFFNTRFNERRNNAGINSLGHQVGTVAGSNGGRSRTNYGIMADDVYTFTPTTFLNTRMNWTRFTEGNRNFSTPFDLTGAGFPAAVAAASTRAILPRITFDAASFGRFTGVGDQGGRENPQDVYQLFSTLTKIRGRHSIKVGTDIRRYGESDVNYGDSAGRYNFGTQWTRGPLDNSPSAPLGQDFAALLLGLPTSGNFDINAARTNFANYAALFVHDDFRVNSKLTLNMGLRWERDYATSERYNRTIRGFDLTTANPIESAARAAYARAPIAELPVDRFRVPGGLLFASPSERAVYKTRSRYFSPRIGVAWSAGPKTVVRGGFGLFYQGLGSLGVNQHGFSQQTQLVASQDGFLTPYATLANPFPQGIEQPTGSSLGLSTYLGRQVNFQNSDLQNPNSKRWTISIQRQMSASTVVEAGYVGSSSGNMDVNRQLNFVPRQFLSTNTSRDQAVIDRLTAQVANPFAGLLRGTSLDASVVGPQQLLQPFPQFPVGTNSLRIDGANLGSSTFHMFQARFEQRFSRDLTVLANYQYSRLMERRSFLNDFDTELEKRVAAEDRPQRFVASFSYDLPFGRGKRFGTGAHKLVNGFIGGWVVNGIYTIQPGPPMTWGNLIYYGGDLEVNPRNIDRVFNIDRFNRNAREQLDFNVRTFSTRFANLRSDGSNNLDFSFLKNTHLREKMNLQFRCEFFNGLNHPTFNPPQLSATNANFGKITQQANVSRRIQMALRFVF